MDLPIVDFERNLLKDKNNLHSSNTVTISELSVLEWIKKIHKFGFAILQGLPPDPNVTFQICKKIGYFLDSPFGSHWDYTVEADNIIFQEKDTAYSNEEIHPHTDGTYCISSPGIQVFHLLSHTGGKGGRTFLVDGFNIANIIKEKTTLSHSPTASLFKYLVETPFEWYHRDDSHDLSAFEPVIKLDHDGNLQQFRFNNLDRAPPSVHLSKSELDQYYYALEVLLSETRSSKNLIEFQLFPGQVLAVNNWRVLHGRREFTGKRRMCGCYMPMDVFMSKLRVIFKQENDSTKFV